MGKGRIASALVVALVCAAVLGFMGNLIFDTDDRYAIDYDLDGGEFVGDHPGYYFSGDRVDLPVPVKNGYYFQGWFLDEGCSEPIGSITDTTQGDIILHAEWGHVSPVGLSYNLDDMTYSIWNYESGRSFVMISEGDGDGFTFWTYSDDMDYVGNENVLGVQCSSWVVGPYTLFLDSSQPNAISIDGTMKYLSGSSDFDIVEPCIMGDVDTGMTVIDGSISYGGSVTLSTAVPARWIVDGVTRSNSTVFVIDSIAPGTSYRATTGQNYNIGDDDSFGDLGLGEDVRIYDASGEIIAQCHGDTTVRLNLDPGTYLAVGGSDAPFASKTISMGVLKTFDWRYGGSNHHMELYMTESDVMKYLDEYDADSRVYKYYIGHDTDGVYSAYASKYFTTDDAYVREVATKLSESRGSMDDSSFASYVLHFVGSIGYAYDDVSRGQVEFYKFPAETLWDHSGDCEDFAILYATLMSILGYDSGIITLPNHAMAVIDVGEYNDNGFFHGDVWYTYCETTNAFDIGEFGYNPVTHSPNDVDENDIVHRLFIEKVNG